MILVLSYLLLSLSSQNVDLTVAKPGRQTGSASYTRGNLLAQQFIEDLHHLVCFIKQRLAITDKQRVQNS